MKADDLPISFFSYIYTLVEPTVVVEGLQIAGLLDIGLMKLDAVAGRGSRKDFYDLYFIVSQVGLSELFALSEKKYPYSRGFQMRVLTALVDFDIADYQPDPVLLQPATWQEVKAFFTDQACRLGENWFKKTTACM